MPLYQKGFRRWRRRYSKDVKVAGAARRPSALPAAAAIVHSQHRAPAPAPVCAIDVKRFHPLEDAEEMYAHLIEHGFVVVREVADDEAIRKAKTLLWDYLEAHSRRVLEGSEDHVDRNDPDTWWCDKTWAPNAKDGIIYGQGIGQSEFMWHLRLLPRVRQAFAAVWSRDDARAPRTNSVAAGDAPTNCRPGYALRSSAGAGEAADSMPSGARTEGGGGYSLRSTQGGRKRTLDFAAMVGKRRRSDARTDSVEDDLLVSFDGAGVFRPWRGRLQPTKGGWYRAVWVGGWVGGCGWGCGWGWDIYIYIGLYIHTYIHTCMHIYVGTTRTKTTGT